MSPYRSKLTPPVASDEACAPVRHNDNEQDAPNNDAASNDAPRSKIVSAEVFDSEGVPSPDNFIQKRALRSKHMPHGDDCELYGYGDADAHAIDADTSDSSQHEFIAPGAASNDAVRSNILCAEVFDSDVP